MRWNDHIDDVGPGNAGYCGYCGGRHFRFSQSEIDEAEKKTLAVAIGLGFGLDMGGPSPHVDMGYSEPAAPSKRRKAGCFQHSRPRARTAAGPDGHGSPLGYGLPLGLNLAWSR
jgi:hypothetical protein